jgi:hypothetical protein
MSEQCQDQPEKRATVEVNRSAHALVVEAASRVPPQVMQLLKSRIGWAAMIGVATPLGFWWLGAIESSRAMAAMIWVLGIVIAAVMLEEGMTRLFRSLVHTVIHEPTAAPNRAINPLPKSKGSTDKR